MKLLVIAAADEGEAIRAAAMRAGGDAIAVESPEGLPGWIAAARPDLVVVSTRVCGTGQLRALAEQVRALAGQEVVLLFVCDPGELEDAGVAGNLALPRPALPDEIVRLGLALIDARQHASGEFTGAPGQATRPASDPGLQVAAALDAPALHPLGQGRDRASSRPPRDPAAGAPWAEAWVPVLAASIERTLDAELTEALRAVAGDAPDAPGAAGSDGRPFHLSDLPPAPAAEAREFLREQPTLELARGAVDTMLAGARLARRATGDDAPTPGPLHWRRAGGGAPLALAGELSEASLPDLLGAALEQALTGRLRLRAEEVEKSIFLEAGRPVLAVSNAHADRMVQMLVREGVLSEAQARRASELASETRRRMGALLIDLGYLKSTELLPAVRRHYEAIIASLFSWEVGRYRFEPGETADPRRVRLLAHPAALVLEGIGRGYSDTRLRQAFGSMEQVLRLRTHPGAADVLLEIGGGDPAVARLPVLFDGVRTVDEVVRVSGQPRAVVLQVALALRAFGLLQGAPGRPGQAEATSGGVLAERDLAVARARVQERSRFVREGTYFDVLGVPADADGDAILAACERMGREFSDAALGPELASELASELVELRAVVAEAQIVLGDPALREAYRAQALPAELVAPPAPEPRAARA